MAGALLPFVAEPAPHVSPHDLVAILADGCWHHREDLARQLHVTVRQIRLAATASAGQILSGPSGLKLTVTATQEEVDECLGRFSSQISEMTTRIVKTRDVWNERVL